MSRRKKPGVSIFIDLDGPILDVRQRQYLVYGDILLQAGFSPINRKAYWNLKRSKVSLEVLLARSGAQSLVAQYRRDWLAAIEKRAALRRERPWPQAPEILTRLKKKYPLILVTLRRSRSNLFWQLSRLGLCSLFDEVLVSRDNNGDWRAKCALMKKSPYLRKDSWMIGDTEIDIEAGKRLGIRTIAVLSGIRNSKLLRKYKPDYVTRDLSGAARIILKSSDTRHPE